MLCLTGIGLSPLPDAARELSSAGRGKRNKASLSICFPFPGNWQQNPQYQSGARLNCSTCYQPLQASSRLQLFPSELDNERVWPRYGDGGDIDVKNVVNGCRSRHSAGFPKVSKYEYPIVRMYYTFICNGYNLTHNLVGPVEQGRTSNVMAWKECFRGD